MDTERESIDALETKREEDREQLESLSTSDDEDISRIEAEIGALEKEKSDLSEEISQLQSTIQFINSSSRTSQYFQTPIPLIGLMAP